MFRTIKLDNQFTVLQINNSPPKRDDFSTYYEYSIDPINKQSHKLANLVSCSIVHTTQSTVQFSELKSMLSVEQKQLKTCFKSNEL